jgi:hypothetical protein
MSEIVLSFRPDLGEEAQSREYAPDPVLTALPGLDSYTEGVAAFDFRQQRRIIEWISAIHAGLESGRLAACC